MPDEFYEFCSDISDRMNLFLKHFFRSFCLFLLLSCEPSKKNGEHIVYFPNSKAVKQSIDYLDGYKHGYFKNFYRKGHPKMIQHFVRDTLHDTTVYFHENGRPSEKQVFNMGKKNGCWQKFNKEGHLYWKACFENDLLEGEFVQYTYKTLKPYKKEFYVKGALHGRREAFYNSGKPMSVSYFHHGRALDRTKEWTEDGRMIENKVGFKVREVDEVALAGRLVYHVRLSDPQSDDEVYIYNGKDEHGLYKMYQKLDQQGPDHVFSVSVGHGSVVMETMNLVAIRKTAMGNQVFSTHALNVSAVNY